jgi:hypothetical protein
MSRARSRLPLVRVSPGMGLPTLLHPDHGEPHCEGARRKVGDVACDMIVTDLVTKKGGPKFFGVGIVASSTSQDTRKAVTVEPDREVAIQRPRSSYRAPSRF